jgi:serine/threonine protein kinase
MRMAGSPANRKAVEDEAKAVALLCMNGEPNIIHVLDHGYLSFTNYYIDMELCDISLAELLKREKRKDGIENWYLQWPIENFDDRVFFILALMQELSNGLYFIHGHNQVHRDIKPENGLSHHQSIHVTRCSALFRQDRLVEAHRLRDHHSSNHYRNAAHRRITLHRMLCRPRGTERQVQQKSGHLGPGLYSL